MPLSPMAAPAAEAAVLPVLTETVLMMRALNITPLKAAAEAEEGAQEIRATPEMPVHRQTQQRTTA